MLFKILHGDASRISTNITPYHEGYCYVTHNGDFYVDMNDERVKLNAKDAETIMGASLANILVNTDSEIPTSSAVLSAIEEAAEVYVGPTRPTDPNIKVWINTAEEGTGVVPVLPRIATITLVAANWTGSSNPWSQVVEITADANIGISSKLDPQPTAQQIVSMQNEETSIMLSNEGGYVVAYAIGNKPTVDYTMQVLITEVAFV